MVTLRAPVIPLNPQLDLPLPEWGCCLPPVPPAVPSMAPQQRWATLSATTQAQARQTLLHILQEICHAGFVS
jgi:hypothetical protein